MEISPAFVVSQHRGAPYGIHAVNVERAKIGLHTKPNVPIGVLILVIININLNAVRGCPGQPMTALGTEDYTCSSLLQSASNAGCRTSYGRAPAGNSLKLFL